jgi:hypothetical protein
LLVCTIDQFCEPGDIADIQQRPSCRTQLDSG